MKPITRHHLKLIDAAEAIRLDPDKTEAAFMARQLVQATLPHKNPGDVPAWSRTNGNLTLGIQPSWDFEKGKSIGYPYGTIPRKPRHDLRYTSVHVSRPYPVYINSNNTNCCVELN
jgi:hypothetical protein